MEFRHVKFFDRVDNAASSFVRFHLFFKYFKFCIDLQFFLNGGKPFAMFSPLYLIWKSNHTSFLFLCLCSLSISFCVSLFLFLCLCFYIYITLHDMLKCNMNFLKSLELNNKKCLQQEVENTYWSTPIN